MDKKKKIVLRIILLSVMFLVLAFSVAYFVTNINIRNKMTANLNTGTMSLRFADNDNGIKAQLSFGETITKKFLIENTGSLEASLSLDWLNLINSYLYQSLSYNLTYCEQENGEYRELIPETNIPSSNTPITSTIASEISVPAEKTYYYNLNITLNDLEDIEQSNDLNATFTTAFTVDVPFQYRYYNLNIDPNGGTWKEYTGPQVYPLKNNETMNIDNPTRYGYTFNKWDIQGISYELENNVFTMGISDAYLRANWSANKIKVTVDGRERMVDFDSTIDLGTPTREGYTFTGWETTGGTLENNILIVNEDKDITVTPTYEANTYKYIVYHHKMNVDGIGYTLVSADTDEGEDSFGNEVKPKVNTYTGFTSPAQKTLTIQVETEYPPVKNKVDYNYDRNKYTLTKNVAGEITTEEVFYGSSIDLGIPTKTGYDFTNWSVTDGTLEGNILTVIDKPPKVKANFTPKTCSVIFNANGGTTEEASKIVSYDSIYGDLPIPTLAGYVFTGWYTERVGGIQITESTKVETTANHTLYAQWEMANLFMARTSGDKIWKHDTEIKEIVFEKTMSPKDNAVYTYDVSASQNGSVMSYVVPTASDNTKYTVYIQADGEITMNPYSWEQFSGFINLEKITGFENVDTSKMRVMNYMFQNCEKLVDLDLSSFNTSNVTKMEGVFTGCRSLTTLDLSSFDTSNVITMKNMFDMMDYVQGLYSNENNLTTIILSDKFKTDNVTTMESMFRYCKALESIDLSNFNTSNVTDMSHMFRGCRSLTGLDLTNFDTSKVTTMAYMFDMQDNQFKDSKLTTLKLSDKFNTSNVTDMRSMFYDCISLVELDVSHFDTSNVTNMDNLFSGCKSIVTLEVSNFNTSQVTSFLNIFSNCYKVKTLDLSNWDVSKITSMVGLFERCRSLESLNLRNWNTSNVTNMTGMFKCCPSLIELDLTSFDTSNVTTMESMFLNLKEEGAMEDSKLTTIKFSSKFNTSNVKNMANMFQGCNSLTTMDLSLFDTSNVTKMSRMFSSCYKLTTTITIRGTKCTEYSEMFKSTSITSGQIMVNYTSDASDLANAMIATKSSTSNVVKGSVVS